METARLCLGRQTAQGHAFACGVDWRACQAFLAGMGRHGGTASGAASGAGVASDDSSDDEGVSEWVEGEAETRAREEVLSAAFAGLGVTETTLAGWFRGAAARLDTYQGIQVVNSLRRAALKGGGRVGEADFGAAVAAAEAGGDGEGAGLVPVVEGDPLIAWLLDLDLDDDEGNGGGMTRDDSGGGGALLRGAGAGPVTVVEEALVDRAPTEGEIAVARALHEAAWAREEGVTGSSASSGSSDGGSSESDDGDAGRWGAGTADPAGRGGERGLVGPAGHEKSYFASYDGWAIHREMVGDVVRTRAYADAIGLNADAFRGKTVLDVGCGTGILSMFAARAGAARVVGVDMAEIVTVARANVARNGLAGVIEIHRGKLEVIANTVLRDLRVDIIVSEWMGYALLFESMLDSVLFARERFLVEGGRVYPDRRTLHLCGVSDPRRLVRFWDDVYGFDMRPVGDLVQRAVVPHAVVDTVGAQDVLTAVADIRDVPCETVASADLEFSQAFSIAVEKDGPLDAVAIYFDTFFREGLATPVSFSTGPVGPDRPATHWQQTLLFLDPSPDVLRGDVVRGRFSLARNRGAPRCLDLSLEYTVLGPDGAPTPAFATGDRIHSYDMWDEPVEHKPRK